MTRKCTIFLAIVLVSLLLFSCADSTGNLQEEMNAEARKAIAEFGTASVIVGFDDPTGGSSRGIDSEVKSIESDGDKVISNYYLVGYDSIKTELIGHLNTIPKEEYKVPALKNKVKDISAKYIVLFRTCFFKGKDNAQAAYREAYLVDVESLEKGNNALLQKLTVSPDLDYDLENEIKISTGEPVKYDWVSGKTEEANRFVEDTATDFSALFSGDTEIKAWKFVTPTGEPVVGTHSVATYVLEVNKSSVEQFFDFALGSFTSEHLRIRNFTYEGEDKEHKAYLEISQYPDGYIHDWETRCYWHDGEKWNYTRYIQTDDDLELIWYKDITEEKLETFFEEAKLIGNITRIYQGYKGTEPMLIRGSSYEYVVEYDSVHENLLNAATNKLGKTIGRPESTQAGPLLEDSVAYVIISEKEKGDSPLRVCILLEQTNSVSHKWYTSYTYFPMLIKNERLVINSRYLDDGKYVYYDYETGKYRDVSNYDGSLYYCEYDGVIDIDGTMGQLGTIDKICYFTGNTGQEKPYIQSFFNSAGSYVAAAVQYSSFSQSVLEEYSTGTRPQNPYFTHGYEAYDLDYDADNLVFAEFDIFFDGEGNVTDVQIRKVTNTEGFDTDDYATAYVMNSEFLKNKDNK